MKAMSFAEVENVVNNYASNNSSTRFGHNFVCVVSLKPSRVYASGKHLIGHVAKVTMVNDARFPKYDSKVASVLGMDITPTKLNGMKWVNYPYIKQSLKDSARYLNIYYAISDAKTKPKTKWLWDGREATPNEVVEIERHLVSSNNNRPVKAAMYQIDKTNVWDGFYYFDESKEEAEKVFNEIGK